MLLTEFLALSTAPVQTGTWSISCVFALEIFFFSNFTFKCYLNKKKTGFFRSQSLS